MTQNNPTPPQSPEIPGFVQAPFMNALWPIGPSDTYFSSDASKGYVLVAPRQPHDFSLSFQLAEAGVSAGTVYSSPSDGEPVGVLYPAEQDLVPFTGVLNAYRAEQGCDDVDLLVKAVGSTLLRVQAERGWMPEVTVDNIVVARADGPWPKIEFLPPFTQAAEGTEASTLLRRIGDSAIEYGLQPADKDRLRSCFEKAYSDFQDREPDK